MIPISIVVMAPLGIAECLIPASLLAQADGGSLEIIVPDGAENFTDASRPGLRHIAMPGATIHGLVRAGLAYATKEWVVLFEDHCRPMTGFLEAYRQAIHDNPEIDLFAGALDNVTSTEPWSFASFLFNGYPHWPQSRSLPKNATVANLMVRRSAILPSDLASDGGFEFAGTRRLVAAGRSKYCEGAVVDHVRPFTARGAFACQYDSARTFAMTNRGGPGGEASLALIARGAARVLYISTLKPLRIMMDLRGTNQFRWDLYPKFALLGLAGEVGVLWVDIKRYAARFRYFRP